MTHPIIRLRTLAARLREEDGVLTAEFTGLLALVGVIIAAIVALDIGGTLTGIISDALSQLTG